MVPPAGERGHRGTVDAVGSRDAVCPVLVVTAFHDCGTSAREKASRCASVFARRRASRGRKRAAGAALETSRKPHHPRIGRAVPCTPRAAIPWRWSRLRRDGFQASGCGRQDSRRTVTFKDHLLGRNTVSALRPRPCRWRTHARVVGVRKCGCDLLTHSKYALDLAAFVNSKVEPDDRHRV